MSDDKSPGMDNLDVKLLTTAGKYISTPMCHILNMCLKNCVRSEAWKEVKVIPLPTDNRYDLTSPNSRPISLLSVKTSPINVK